MNFITLSIVPVAVTAVLAGSVAISADTASAATVDASGTVAVATTLASPAVQARIDADAKLNGNVSVEAGGVALATTAHTNATLGKNLITVTPSASVDASASGSANVNL
jgi:phage gp45-like